MNWKLKKIAFSSCEDLTSIVFTDSILDTEEYANVVRNALKEANGNAEILFQNIGTTAVAKERTKIFKDGCLIEIGIGVGICSIIYGGYNYCKNKMNCTKPENPRLVLHHTDLPQK